jgi:predicted MPP superfamily phosphohydrolase
MRFLYVFAWAYIAWRINAGLKIRRPYSLYLLAGFVLFGALSLIAFFAGRSESMLMSFVYAFGHICMGVCGITVTFFILNDFINLFNLIFKIKKFRYYSTLVTLCLSIAGCAWALANVAFVLNVKEINIKVPGLAVDSLKIVQLSDLHINKVTSPETMKKIFTKARNLNPDLIVITGDVIDTDINNGDKFRDYGFEILKAPYGVFAVTGNHERRRVNAFYEMCGKLGIKVLKNESFLLNNIIGIAGINDADWNDAGSIKSALAGISGQYPVLFLSHRPEPFDTASDQGAAVIQLSGHTHAGQIPPVEIARKFFMKYNYGLYKKGKSVMYVTSGTRWWGPPMRFANTGEIAVITLEKE